MREGKGFYFVSNQQAVNTATREAMVRGGVDKLLAEREGRYHDEDILVDRYASSLMACTDAEVRAAIAKAIV